MSYRLLTAVISVLIGLWSCAAFATTVLEQSFPDLVRGADTILVGTVTAIETDQERDVPFMLVTFAELEVVKGTHQEDEFTVQVMGGPTPDGLRFHIAGVPEFHLGDRMVVFVVGNETQAVPFVGMWQGVYRVVWDTETDTQIMTDHAGRPLTALPQRSQRGVVQDGGPALHPQQGPALTLEAFTQSIVETMQEHMK